MLVGLQRLELTACPQLTSPPNGLPSSLRTLYLGFFMQGSSHLVDISQLSQLRVLKLNCVGVICGPAGSSRLLCLQQLEQLEMRLDHGSQELPVPLTLMFLPRLHNLLIEAPGMCNLSGNLGAALPQLRQLTLFLRSSEELPGSIAELNSLTSLRIDITLVAHIVEQTRMWLKARYLSAAPDHTFGSGEYMTLPDFFLKHQKQDKREMKAEGVDSEGNPVSFKFVLHERPLKGQELEWWMRDLANLEGSKLFHTASYLTDDAKRVETFKRWLGKLHKLYHEKLPGVW
ncbi:unnamed protein product [Closterium sp. NIES-65]|nr:unnamed protein product [Closterium sp. NIES-65]